jgi:hypothetical protein
MFDGYNQQMARLDSSAQRQLEVLRAALNLEPLDPSQAGHSPAPLVVSQLAPGEAATARKSTPEAV